MPCFRPSGPRAPWSSPPSPTRRPEVPRSFSIRCTRPRRWARSRRRPGGDPRPAAASTSPTASQPSDRWPRPSPPLEARQPGTPTAPCGRCSIATGATCCSASPTRTSRSCTCAKCGSDSRIEELGSQEAACVIPTARTRPWSASAPRRYPDTPAATTTASASAWKTPASSNAAPSATPSPACSTPTTCARRPANSPARTPAASSNRATPSPP